MKREEVLELLIEFCDELGGPDQMTPKAFIVHGWDQELKLETKNYLQNTLGLQCVILHEQDGRGDVIINKFERCAGECDIAVVLLSERDDPGAKLGDPNAVKRPRPNVIFEMGYFFAKLGRSRVLILKAGDVEINSDILGVEYVDVSKGVESAGEKIRKRLSSMV